MKDETAVVTIVYHWECPFCLRVNEDYEEPGDTGICADCGREIELEREQPN